MKLNLNKILFFAIWIFLVCLGPISILKNTPLTTLIGHTALIINFLQRMVGLVIFSMLFIQIILGSFMSFWTQKLGGWIFNFHILEGITIYLLVLSHPTFFVLYRYLIGQGLDPFFVFTSVCVFCHSKLDAFYTLGRVAFWFITAAVSAGLFRTSTPFLRVHWKKFHILNYLAFIFVWLHSLFLGTDVGTSPFYYFHGPALLIISGILIYKVLRMFKPSTKAS